LNSAAQQTANAWISAWSLWLVVLGAFLALLGGIVTNVVQQRREDKRVRKNVVTLIRLLLQDYMEVSTRILENYSAAGSFSLELLGEASAIVLLYDRNQEWVMLQSGLTDSTAIYKWFSRARKVIQRAKNTESTIVTPGADAGLVTWAVGQRPNLQSEMNSLRADAQNLLLTIPA